MLRTHCGRIQRSFSVKMDWPGESDVVAGELVLSFVGFLFVRINFQRDCQP